MIWTLCAVAIAGWSRQSIARRRTNRRLGIPTPTPTPIAVAVAVAVALGPMVTLRSPVRSTRRFVGESSISSASRLFLAGSGVLILAGLESTRSVIVPLGCLAGVGAAWWARRVRRQERSARRTLERGAVDVLLLVDIHYSAGAGLREALELAGGVAGSEAGAALRRCLGAGGGAGPLSAAITEWAEEVGGITVPFARALEMADTQGVALGAVVGQMADDARRAERADRLEGARRLPVRILVPVVLCFLPAFLLLSIIPVLVGALDSLSRSGLP